MCSLFQDEKRSVPTAKNNTEPIPPIYNLDLTNSSTFLYGFPSRAVNTTTGMSPKLINLQAEQPSEDGDVVTLSHKSKASAFK